MILTIRTDNPTAEFSLYKEHTRLEYMSWAAGRNLSVDIHNKLEELFALQGIDYKDIKGIVFYEGPGSFTGLRIGASVANTIASEMDVPIVGTSGEQWIKQGIDLLRSDPSQRLIVPKYGSSPKTTKPKK